MKEYTTRALYEPENITRQARTYLDEHNPKHAPSLWFVVGNHDETAQLVEVCGDIIHDDAYDLLDTARHQLTRQKMKNLLTHTRPQEFLRREVLGVAILTTGWASPLPADYEGDASSITPPSQHPERRRVEVLVFEGWGGASACIRFDDAKGDTLGSGGVGTLADELESLWAYLVRETAEDGTQPPVCYFCGTVRPLGAALHEIRTLPTPSVSAVVARRFICSACEKGTND